MVKTVTEVLKMLPSTCGLGQFFTIRTSQPANNIYFLYCLKADAVVGSSTFIRLKLSSYTFRFFFTQFVI